MSMFVAAERMDEQELVLRHEKCRKLMDELAPGCGGLLVFSRVNIYYLTGHMGNGLFWLPREGEPVLFCRRGRERAEMESPIKNIVSFRSYSDIEPISQERGSPLTPKLGVETTGLNWSLGKLLEKKLQGYELAGADMVLTRARAVKTQWELAKMRLCGARHDLCLQKELPGVIRPGMTEREIAHKAWEVFFAHGHQGMIRMGAFGEEIFLGHVSAGVNGNYPSVFNGPVGVMGEHPAAAQMGYAGKVWEEGELLTLDIGFFLEGYQTDKTQVYFAGSKSMLDERMKKGHAFCVEIQNWLAEHLKPGAVPSQLYTSCMERAENAGMEEGFMALEGNKVVFLGHGIGLAIDEYPVLARKFDEPLEEAMTLALEPKFGIPHMGMVGVENTFEVTEKGGKCLTGDTYDIICLE